jgi:hypothetical protein
MIAIDISTLPHFLQKYDTMGNWYEDRGMWVIEVDEMEDWKKEFLVALHEQIEMALCKARGISEESVSEFDLAHPDSPEPGEEMDAPYRKEHLFAEAIERLVANELGVTWGAY